MKFVATITLSAKYNQSKIFQKLKPLNLARLAIEGGQPAFPDGPPIWPVADDTIRASVLEALESGEWGRYEGQLSVDLHRNLESTFQLSHSLLCSSGTISVELALRGIGVKAGDEVILSAYDFPGNFRSIEAVGAVPVLVDVVTGGWVIDPKQVPIAVSEKTVAIIVSHLHGQIADVKAIQQYAKSHDLKIIEDVCQSPGAQFAGELLGTFGDVATFSFGGSKLLSAGRGGAVLSNDEAIIQRAKIFAHRGNDAFPLSQIQAALLLPQLEQLQSRNRQRHGVAKKIVEVIEPLVGLSSLSLGDAGETVGGFYKLPIMIDTDAPFDRARFLAVVQAEGVAMDIGFRGFAKRSTRRCRHVGSLEHSIHAAVNTMLLHHPILLATDDHVQRLIDVIERCHTFCLNVK